MTIDIDFPAPRYRIVGPRPVPWRGIIQPQGFEFDDLGWPSAYGPGIEPANETAERIVAFENSHRFHPGKPPTPFDRDHGRLVLMEPGGESLVDVIRTVPDHEALPGMPAYRALAPIVESESMPRRRFPHRKIVAGTIIHMILWPASLNENEFEPANPQAEAVIRYYIQARKHPLMLASPWDWMSRAIFLPELPAIAAVKGNRGASRVASPRLRAA